MKTPYWSLTILFCVLALSSAALARDYSNMTLEVLPSPPGGTDCDGYAMNNRGEVMGWCDRNLEGPFPVLWVDGEPVWLEGPVEIPDGDGYVIDGDVELGIRGAINNAGTIAALLAWSSPLKIGVGVWTGSGWRILALNASSALGMNNRGEIAGRLPGGIPGIISEQAITELEMPPWSNFCNADDINDRGEVAGECYDPGLDETKPVFWDRRGAISELASDNLSDFQFARRINNQSLIVGSESDRAVKWEHGEVVELAPKGWALGVNEHGDIVGFVGINGAVGADTPAAAVWPAGSTTPVYLPEMVDGTVSLARIISSRGQICGKVCADSGSGQECFAAVWR